MKKGEHQDNIIRESICDALIKIPPINTPGLVSGRYIWYAYLPGKWRHWNEDEMLVSLLNLYRNNGQHPTVIVSEMNGFIEATLNIIQKTIS